MIITLASQKGGVGKSTISVLLVNYLIDKNYPVHVVDFDKQGSLVYQSQKKDLKENDNLSFQSGFEDNEALQEEASLEQLEKSKTIFLFDTAGHIDEQYKKVLRHSSFIIVPIEYTELVLHSTIKFGKFLKDYTIKEKVIFLPNKIDRPRKEVQAQVFDTYSNINKVFENYGRFTENMIYYQKNMTSLTLVSSTFRQKKNTQQVFNELHKLMFQNYEE